MRIAHAWGTPFNFRGFCFPELTNTSDILVIVPPSVIMSSVLCIISCLLHFNNMTRLHTHTHVWSSGAPGAVVAISRGWGLLPRTHIHCLYIILYTIHCLYIIQPYNGTSHTYIQPSNGTPAHFSALCALCFHPKPTNDSLWAFESSRNFVKAFENSYHQSLFEKSHLT